MIGKDGHHTLPIIAGDFNSGFGIRRDVTGTAYIKEDGHIGVCEPVHESNVSMQIRQFAAEQHMSVATTHWTTGPTYFQRGASSKIEHFICPTPALASIQKANTLIRLGRKLQLQPSATLEDHVPVYVEMVLPKRKYSVHAPSPPAHRDHLMQAQTTGNRRQQYFESVTRHLENDDDSYKAAMQSNNVQAVWDHIGGAVRRALEEVFPPGPRRTAEYETYRRQRVDLIRRRGWMRAEGANKNEEEFERVQQQLHQITRRLQNLRKQQTADTRQALLHELAQVWRNQQWAQMHKIKNSLTSTGRGPKKRYIFAVRRNMTVEEWRDGLQLQPHQGGLQANSINWDDALDDVQFLPKVLERDRAIQLAQADFEGQIRYLKKAPKRRATPRWGVHAEALLQLLSPEFHSAEDPNGNGWEVDITPTAFLHKYQQFVTLVRETDQVPLSFLRSQMFAHSKDSGVIGIRGQRLLHCFDSCSMSWFGQLARRLRVPPKFPSFAHGGIPGRRREGAILALSSAMWRCRDLKLSRTLSNYDGTNAFASTDRGHLRALHSAQHYEPNIELCKHAVDDLVVHAHGIDGWRSLGKLWAEPLPPRMRILLFIAYVQSAGLSGLTGFVPPRSFTDKLDAVFLRFLRVLSRGTTEEIDGKVSGETYAQVFAHHKLSRTVVELRIQRIRWYQKMARHPQRHSQVLTGIFGSTRLDLAVDRPRMGMNGDPNEHSTPWARQVYSDLEIFAKVDPASRFAQAWNSRDGLLDFFRKEEFRKVFDGKWLQHIRHLFDRHYGAEEKEVKYKGVEYMEGGEDANEFICTHETPEGHVCGSVFTTMRALAAHLIKTHKLRELYSMLTTTNAQYAMSWMIGLPAQGSQGANAGGGPRRGGRQLKRARGKGAGAGSGEDVDATTNEKIFTLQKLTLNNTQTLRILVGALRYCLIVPMAHAAASEGTRMGQECHRLSTEEKRKDLGPLHLHIFGCIIPTLVKMQGLSDDAKAILEPFAKLMTSMDREEPNDLVRYFRLKKTYNEDNQKADQAKIHVMLSPIAISPFHRPQLIQRYRGKTGDQTEMPNATIAEIRLHIIKALVASGGVVKIGSPPPGALERAVQAS
ncbi:unnamed protein product, partial [Prorocentrum cordatum]